MGHWRLRQGAAEGGRGKTRSGSAPATISCGPPPQEGQPPPAGVVIFKRDEQGLLLEQIFAQQGGPQGRHLSLTAPSPIRGKPPHRKKPRPCSIPADAPGAAGSRSGDPEEMTFSDLNYFVENQGFGIRPTYVYEPGGTSGSRLFVIAVVMVALCVPLASRFRRGGGTGSVVRLGIGLGSSSSCSTASPCRSAKWASFHHARRLGARAGLCRRGRLSDAPDERV